MNYKGIFISVLALVLSNVLVGIIAGKFFFGSDYFAMT